MRSWPLVTLCTAVCGLIVFACSGDGSGGGPFGGGGSGGSGLDCSTLSEPPAGCGELCPSGSDSECPLGTFCQNRACAAQCTAEEGCGSGFVCNVRGRCVLEAGTGGTGGTGNTGGDGCQSVQVTPTRSIPNVMFLVDQSGSMVEGFGSGKNRWEAAHDAITSIVSDTDSIVRYGLTTYTSNNGDQNPPCPRLPTQVGFALGNASTIGNDNIFPYSYPSQDGDDTPTGDSIDALVSVIEANPPPAQGPNIIVLATDGEPDSCECPDGGHPLCSQTPAPVPPRDQAVNAAANAHASGWDVYVLWVGELTSGSISGHIQDVANAGVGLPTNGSQGDAPFWVGTDPQELEDNFRDIIGASISCEVQIDKPFDDRQKACDEGEVRLNGTRLDCPTEWQVKDEPPYDVIELVGSACDTFKSGAATLTAEFPCGAIVVQ